MPRTRQQAASRIAPDSIAQLTSVFDALPEKTKDTYTLREVVSQLDAPIRTALGRGYSHDEIAAILAEHEIAISAFSLKRYLSLNKTGQAQQAEGTGEKRRRGRQPKSESGTAAQSADAVVDQRSQPAPKRRGRAKSIASEQSNVTEAVATLPETQPEAEAAPKRRGRTSKTAAKAKPAAQTTQRTGKGRGRK